MFPDDPGMHTGDNSYTRVRYRENQSFCTRVKNSLVAIVVGCVLIVASVGLLFWNEGRAVQTAKSLDEGLRLVVPLPNAEAINEYNYGKLVHTIGSLNTGKVLFDEKYGIAVAAVKLRRKVEMYQWVEHESKREINEGDRTREEITYSYTQEWRSEIVRSDTFEQAFNHQNPKAMPFTSQEYMAKDTRVGAFYLSENLASKITNWKKLKVTQAPANDPYLRIHDEKYFYHGREPVHPVVGDVRVCFEYAGLAGHNSNLGPPDMVSVIAKQLHGQLVGYQTDAGDVLEILYMGEYSVEKMFGNEQSQNTVFTWAMRFAGWLVMFIGFTCLTQIINTIVDWIPLVRTLVAVGTVALNTSLSISFSLLIIALGWIRYRPLLGLSILACSLIPFILAKFKQSSMSRTEDYRRTRID